MKKILLPFFTFLILGGTFVYAFFGVENISEADLRNDLNAYVSLSNQPRFSFINVGDMMFDRGVEFYMDRGSDLFGLIGHEWARLLKDGGFLVGNLEGPITDSQKCQKKAYSFKFASSTAKLIFENGFRLVNLANNHSFDCYEKGIEDTEANLSNAGVAFFGAALTGDSYSVKIIDGKRVVFLGIEDTMIPANIEKSSALVKKLKTENDFLVVDIHWGSEYEKGMTKRQIKFGHSLIDNGADVVIGHHPHVIEPIEIYKDKAIFYSLGNFIFDQLEEDTNKGIAVGVDLSDKAEFRFKIFPYEIIKSRPQFFAPSETLSFCDDYLKNIPNGKECSF
ncbi:MAG: CapA family protein [Candidatus Paceibacterota bacterium]|jgi:poly-gamma-glutamate synthesis protein (capsule biosynthesis protein)